MPATFVSHWLGIYSNGAFNTSISFGACVPGDLLIVSNVSEVYAVLNGGPASATWTRVGDPGVSGDQGFAYHLVTAPGTYGCRVSHGSFTIATVYATKYSGVGAVNTAGHFSARNLTAGTTWAFNQTFATSAPTTRIDLVRTDIDVGAFTPAWASLRAGVIGLSSPRSFSQVFDSYHPAPASFTPGLYTITLHSSTRPEWGALFVEDSNAPPTAPAPSFPVGGQAIDLSVTNRFAWSFSDPDAGDSQSAYGVRYRQVGTEPWTEVTATSVNQFHDFPPGTFAVGVNYEWQAKTSDGAGAEGPWSASETFTAVAGSTLGGFKVRDAAGNWAKLRLADGSAVT